MTEVAMRSRRQILLVLSANDFDILLRWTESLGLVGKQDIIRSVFLPELRAWAANHPAVHP